MSDCCATNTNLPPVAACPVNGKGYSQVSRRTVLHQVRQPWQQNLTAQSYYFCDDPDCDVVYFDNDQQVILRDAIRQVVGQKSTAVDKPICYCFDIRLTDLQTQAKSSRLKTFIIDHTRNTDCDCEVRNPSGKCCLRDFPQN